MWLNKLEYLAITGNWAEVWSSMTRFKISWIPYIFWKEGNDWLILGFTF